MRGGHNPMKRIVLFERFGEESSNLPRFSIRRKLELNLLYAPCSVTDFLHFGLTITGMQKGLHRQNDRSLRLLVRYLAPYLETPRDGGFLLPFFGPALHQE
jgi:hypothetical protein